MIRYTREGLRVDIITEPWDYTDPAEWYHEVNRFRDPSDGAEYIDLRPVLEAVAARIGEKLDELSRIRIPALAQEYRELAKSVHGYAAQLHRYIERGEADRADRPDETRDPARTRDPGRPVQTEGREDTDAE